MKTKQVPLPNYLRHTPKGVRVSKNLETTCDRLELYYDDGRENLVTFPNLMKWGKNWYYKVQVTNCYKNKLKSTLVIYASSFGMYKIIGKEE
jgi:hypothetical protein